MIKNIDYKDLKKAINKVENSIKYNLDVTFTSYEMYVLNTHFQNILEELSSRNRELYDLTKDFNEFVDLVKKVLNHSSVKNDKAHA